MPTVLRLRLRLLADVSVSLATAPAHGWALALIGQHDPAWAEELHPDPPQASDSSKANRDRIPKGPGTLPVPLTADSSEASRLASAAESKPPPFTTSPLYRPAGTLDQDEYRLRARALRADDPHDTLARALVCAGEVVALRLALADDERTRRLCSKLAAHEVPPLKHAACELVRVPSLSPRDPDVRHRSWSTLGDAAPAQRLEVSFQTPACYSHQSQAFTSLEVSRLEKSWRRALDHFPGELKPDWADQVTTEGLEIGGRPETASLFLKDDLRIGFVGDLELTWRPGTPPETRRAFAALAGLADFFGTGAKTALGMGQTRVRVWEE